MTTSWEERLIAYCCASRRGFLFALHWCADFEFWLSGGVFAVRKPWQGGVTYFGWIPGLTNPRHSTSQRSTSHATQNFSTPGEPQLPQLFCPRMVHLLARIISLRQIRGMNPGRSHGSAGTLPLHYSANYKKGLFYSVQWRYDRMHGELLFCIGLKTL